jgi:hypothetical protein
MSNTSDTVSRAIDLNAKRNTQQPSNKTGRFPVRNFRERDAYPCSAGLYRIVDAATKVVGVGSVKCALDDLNEA